MGPQTSYAARFSLATFAFLPNAVRVFFGKCAIVLCFFAAAAFFILPLAACCCALARAYLLVPLVEVQPAPPRAGCTLHVSQAIH
jgi:hypothetical protein